MGGEMMKKIITVLVIFMTMTLALVIQPAVNTHAIENKEMDVVLVLDQSGSMKSNDPDNMMKEAAKKFITMMPSNSRANIITFNRSRSKWKDGLTSLSDDKQTKSATDWIENIKYTGDTDVGNAVADALDMFDVNDKAKSDKYVNIIKTEIDRTLTLLNDFQQFTKITIEKKNFDLNLLLEDVKAAISPLSNKYKVEVDFQTENSLEIYADYNRLKQVMINIIKNGIEASEGRKHSKILITSYIDNGKLYFIVKDNGVGMKKEIMEKLTVPFCTTKQTGSGLGICLSNEIINAHGGRLKFDSKVGYGTTAKVILPIK